VVSDQASASPPRSVAPAVVGRNAWTLLATAAFAQVTISVAEMGVPTIAPFLKDGLGLSAAGVGLLVACVNLGRIFGSLPAGRVVDRIGEYPVMLVGGCGVAVFFALASLGRSALVVGIALALAGVFAGSATPAGAKLVLVAFPAGRRGLPMGIRQSAVPFGTLVAAATLPALADATSWHTALMAGGAAPLLGSALVWLLMRRSSATAVGREPGAAHGLHLRSVARDRSVAYAAAWGAVFVGGQYAVVSYLILDLTTERHTSLGHASLALVVASAGGVLGRIGWGVVSDVLFGGRSKPAMLGLTIAGTLSALGLMLMPRHPPLSLVLVAALASGLSLVGWQGVWMGLLSELAPRGAAGTTMGYGLTFVNVTIVAWPPIFGAVADATGGFRSAWALLAVTTALSALLIAGIREPDQALAAAST
jgi:sugar phosphate permease